MTNEDYCEKIINSYPLMDGNHEFAVIYLLGKHYPRTILPEKSLQTAMRITDLPFNAQELFEFQEYEGISYPYSEKLHDVIGDLVKLGILEDEGKCGYCISGLGMKVYDMIKKGVEKKQLIQNIL